MAAKIPEQKIADCRELYLMYGGVEHDRLVAEMHARGWTSFNKRNLYARTRNGHVEPGWPERFGWTDAAVRRAEKRRGDTSTRRRGVSARHRSKHGIAYAKRRMQAREHTPIGSADLKISDKKRANRVNACRDRLKRERSTNSIDSPDSIDSTDSKHSPSFHAWLKTLPGIWDWDERHQLYLYEKLQKVTDGECRRLMIFMPPRHGKSELVTVRYTAWRLKKNPELNVILGSYAQSLADKFSRKIRRVLTEDYQLTAETQRRGEEEERAGEMSSGGPNGRSRPATPDTFSLSSQRLGGCAVDPVPAGTPFPFLNARPINRVSEWETSAGGGLRSVGVGTGVTGYGASLIVIDDPVKSREQANSERFRERVWDWFNDDIYTRLEPEGSIILIQTRWHEDDLAGRLLRDMHNGGERWDVVNLPALAESAVDAATPRDSDAGVPEEDAGGLEEDAETRGERDAGTLSDVERFRSSRPNESSDLGEDVPASLLPRVSASTTAPAPCDPLNRMPGEPLWPKRFGVEELEAIRMRQGEFAFASLYQQRPVPAEGGVFKREWFTDIVARPPQGLRWKRGWDLAGSLKSSADYTATFRVAYDNDGVLYIDGGFRARIDFAEQKRRIEERIMLEPDTEHGIENALHGLGMLSELRRVSRVRGRRFIGVNVFGDKYTRALAWQTLASEGRIRLVRGKWNRAFVEEVCSFPHGRHDDQVDAVSIAVSMFESRSSKLYVF